MLPAIVAPKLKTCTTVAGATGVSTKCFPPTPATTTKTRNKTKQAQFWYLRKLRTLSPQKDTYPSKGSEIVVTQGTTFTYEKGDQRDDHNPNANENYEI